MGLPFTKYWDNIVLLIYKLNFYPVERYIIGVKGVLNDSKSGK